MRAKRIVMKKQDLKAVVVLEDIFSDFINCHEKCRLCFKDVTERDSRIQITDDIEKKINSVLQVHFSLDGTGSDFMCSKCENILNDSHQSKFKINDKLKCYEKFSNKKVDNVRIELSVPIHYNFIKVEDELNISTEMELVSPMNEVKEESSEDESLKDHDEVKNEEENELENQDQSNPQLILCDAGGKVFKNDHSVKRHQCDICGLTATCKFNISSHMNTHKEFRTKDFQCQICGNSYFNKNVLRYHILKNHEKPKHLTCSLYSRTFTTEEGIESHKLRPCHLPCEVCGKMILNKELKPHLNTVHFNIKPYQCDICGRKFNKKTPLAYHLNTHIDFRTKDFDCQICESSYLSKAALRSHILKNHERPKHLTCSLCRRCFKTEKSLKNHKLRPCRLPCEVCGKILLKENLKHHINRVHYNIKPYQCDICGLKTSRKTHLANHVNTHNDFRTKKFHCQICESSFFDKGSLQFHILNVHEKPKHLTCSLCRRTFATEEGLKNHKLQPHRLNHKVSCKLCGKMISKVNLQIHLRRMHSSIRRYQCDICEKKFCTKADLAHHMIRHINLKHRTRDYHCQICESSFFDKGTLQFHILNVHEKPKHLTCSLCRKSFRTEEGLKNHKLRPHKVNEPCEICGKSIRNLKMHLNIMHFSTIRYQCDICGKKISSKTYLAYHVNNHKDFRTKDFHCQICRSSYFDKKTLKSHIRNVHEKKLTCLLCGKTFKKKESLKNHKLLPHHFRCDICGKRFPTKHLILRHQNMHQERNFTCDVHGCQKKFKTKSNLKKHILTVHKKIGEPCPVGNGCKYSVRRRDSMKRHLKVHKELSREELENYWNKIRTMNFV
ncbi:CLUMA_CG009346, isoform A [Clunio marinus]|uniref:CLUMA_CG009346, isoform A n=1 Tax=Clunio marinus TaxID=568069 RepID=A0A1J1I8K2_9DIPT|nr:CLUMA_CG009346, isoform A [Clunio marinus]